jgi:hypothetical protein
MAEWWIDSDCSMGEWRNEDIGQRNKKRKVGNSMSGMNVFYNDGILSSHKRSYTRDSLFAFLFLLFLTRWIFSRLMHDVRIHFPSQWSWRDGKWECGIMRVFYFYSVDRKIPIKRNKDEWEWKCNVKLWSEMRWLFKPERIKMGNRQFHYRDFIELMQKNNRTMQNITKWWNGEMVKCRSCLSLCLDLLIF